MPSALFLRGQTYSFLGLAFILKEKEPENLTCSWTQAAPKYQEGPHGLSLAHTPELLPSYFLATVNQRLVWLFQMYFQTVCDSSSCFRAPTCGLIVILLYACQTGHSSPSPSHLLLFSYKNLFCWGFKGFHPAGSGLGWRRAQAWGVYNKDTLMLLH